MCEVAGVLVDRINHLSGEATVILPLEGISKYDKEGQPLYDSDLDKLLFDALRNGLCPEKKIIEVQAHINDMQFAEACVSVLLEYLTSALCTQQLFS